MIGDRARATAERRLNESCTIRAPGVDTFDPDDGITPVDGALRWGGACRLGAPGTGTRTTAGGDDREIVTRLLQIPSTGTARIGDRVAVAGRTDTYVVIAVDDRADPVLRHLDVIESADAPQVPR